ncbi:hypothetical protein HYPSUDRAFT_57985 [Hypholoma sublateritium FD-334 SS-4]|uniref:Uncharacterized protein n=1 Tax=Hypholoma sublateritium (strain FD-334 SS-4) TaxID=945553 RepID=A0A0D2NJX8_HYPSF|nr:hypothetical protein HYPSUDRAFT_57985 [Hypholoma sublateritium FD-334 SS-4]
MVHPPISCELRSTLLVQEAANAYLIQAQYLKEAATTTLDLVTAAEMRTSKFHFLREALRMAQAEILNLNAADTQAAAAMNIHHLQGLPTEERNTASNLESPILNHADGESHMGSADHTHAGGNGASEAADEGI